MQMSKSNLFKLYQQQCHIKILSVNTRLQFQRRKVFENQFPHVTLKLHINTHMSDGGSKIRSLVTSVCVRIHCVHFTVTELESDSLLPAVETHAALSFVSPSTK